MRIFTTLAVTVMLALAACGDDDGDDAGFEAPAETTTTAADGTTTTAGDAGGVPPRDCRDLQEAPDGVYSVGEAGEVEVRRDGDRLALVEARPAQGWSAGEDDADDDDEVEVTFRRDADQVEFEAEIDDGRMEIEVCGHGDDDRNDDDRNDDDRDDDRDDD